MDFSKIPTTPRHKAYGFGTMKVGDVLEITPDFGDTLVKLRCHISSYAQYKDKKFRTRINKENQTMFVQRIK